MLQHADTINFPELVADLPSGTSKLGSRDFSQCPRVHIVTPNALEAGRFEFVLTNELGQTWSWPLSRIDQSGLYGATLDATGTPWPGSNEATVAFPTPECAAVVRDQAVRMALRFARSIQVKSVQCCDLNDENCWDINDDVPKVNALYRLTTCNKRARIVTVKVTYSSPFFTTL